MLKYKSSSMIMNTYQGHMTWYSNSNLSHMLLVWSLSFVKLLWPLLRFSSCTHDQDTCTPTNKPLTLTLRVTQKQDFSNHQIITPFIYHVSLSKKFHMPKRIVWAMLKKGKKKMPCQKAWEKKMHAKEHKEKKRKRKKEIR